MSVPQSVKAVPAGYAVVERVAALEGVDPTELPPLYESIDVEALERLVEAAEGAGSSLRVEFSYYGHEVSITGEGAVRVARTAGR